MPLFLVNKRILLGITGSIAAYKSAELTRRLREQGASVRVVMTENAKRFITPLTMQAISGYPVHDDLFDLQMENAMGHIELAKWADVILIAPASADCMARLAGGAAHDLLTTLCLATRAPIMLAPAMNQGMWLQEVTQTNREILEQKGLVILEPAQGSQACGDIGPGRMMEPDEIVKNVSRLFETGELAGLSVLMTAGPTHEAIDPIRYLANHSSGKMGFALMEAAREAGAQVTMIHGPVLLNPPSYVPCIAVKTAQEMHDAVMQHIAQCDIFLAVAAVSDYRAEKIAKEKIHKQEAKLALQLMRNPDIVASVGELENRPFVVGFTIETEDLLERAKAKRIRKKMDMIIANRFSEDFGMGHDENEVTVISDRIEQALPKTTKHELARQLVKLIVAEYRTKNA